MKDRGVKWRNKGVERLIPTQAPSERLGTGSSLSSPNTVEFFYRFVFNNFKSLSVPSWLTQYPCSNGDNDGAAPRLTLWCALQPLKTHISTLVCRSCSTWCIQQKKKNHTTRAQNRKCFEKISWFFEVKKRREEEAYSRLGFKETNFSISLNKHSVHVDPPLQKEKWIFL